MERDSILDRIRNECGIDVDAFEGTVSDLMEQGFRIVTDDEVSSLSSLFQYAPQILAQKATEGRIKAATDGSFRLIMDSGRHLAKSTKNPERFSSITFDTDNKNMRPAEWIANDAVFSVTQVEQIIANVFAACSFITGQYYQAQLTSHMKVLVRDVDSVKSYLKNKRRGEFQSYVNQLTSLAEHMRFIVADDNRRSHAAQDSEHMARFFDEILSSCKAQIESLFDGARQSDSVEEVNQMINAITNELESYHQSVILYCDAINLVVLLNRIINPDEIMVYYNEMSCRIIRFEVFARRCGERLDEYISSVSVLNKISEWKSIQSVLKGAGFAGLEYVGISSLLGGPLGGIFAVCEAFNIMSLSDEKYYAEIRELKKAIIDRIKESLEPYLDISSAYKAIKSLKDYRRIVSNIEFIRVDDVVYTNIPLPANLR